MGVWRILKDAGKPLFASRDEAATLPQANALLPEIKSLGLDTSGVEIKVEGKTVSPRMREKIILGNGAGVAEAKAEADGAEPTFHVVKKGNTLSAIARKALGNTNRTSEMSEANRPMLTYPDKICPGQTLRIPA